MKLCVLGKGVKSIEEAEEAGVYIVKSVFRAYISSNGISVYGEEDGEESRLVLRLLTKGVIQSRFSRNKRIRDFIVSIFCD